MFISELSMSERQNPGMYIYLIYCMYVDVSVQYIGAIKLAVLHSACAIMLVLLFISCDTSLLT